MKSRGYSLLGLQTLDPLLRFFCTQVLEGGGVGGAGGAGVNMAGSGNGRTFSYEVDGMSMDDER